MTDLLLQPTGDPDDYEVVLDGQVVGRIVLLTGAWSWAIDTAFRPGRLPVYGFEPTRDAAMQASARSWHQHTWLRGTERPISFLTEHDRPDYPIHSGGWEVG